MPGSPICLVSVNGGSFQSTDGGINVDPGDTVQIKLDSAVGVDEWYLSIFGTDELTETPPTLTNVDPDTGLVFDPEDVVECTFPNATGRALLFRSTAKGIVGNSSTSFGIYSLTSQGARVVAAGETREGNATHGWAAAINPFLRNPGGVTIVLDGDVEGNADATKVVAVQNVPWDATAPVLGQLPAFDGSQWTPKWLGAGDVLYDNTSSGLAATKVQDAIDELADRPSGGGGTSYLILRPGGTPGDNVFTSWEDVLDAVPEEGPVVVLLDGDITLPEGEWDLEGRVHLAGYPTSQGKSNHPIWNKITLPSNVVVGNPISFERLVLQGEGGHFAFEGDVRELWMTDIQVYCFSPTAVFHVGSTANVIAVVKGNTYDTSLNAKTFDVEGSLDICFQHGVSFSQDVAVETGTVNYYIMSSSVNTPSQWGIGGPPANAFLYNDARNIYFDPGSTGLPENVRDALRELADRPSGGGVTPVDTLDDLRAISGGDLVDNAIRLVVETGSFWRYSASTGADEIDDGNTSVKPDSVNQDQAGRWRQAVHNGVPGIDPGVHIPVSYLPAGIQVLGAKPIIDGDPQGPPFFAGIAVDIGDEAGVKKPYPMFGLGGGGNWSILGIDFGTMDYVSLYDFEPDGFKIYIHPNDGPKKITTKVQQGETGFVASDLTLIVEAAYSIDSLVEAGNLILKGGDHGHSDGTGGDVLIKPGKSGGSAARLGISALCDEDEVPVVAVTKDKLAFFGGTLTEKPTIIGDWGDGTAGESLAEKLQDLGLIVDSTVNTGGGGGGGSKTNILASVDIDLGDITSPQHILVYTVPECLSTTISEIRVVPIETLVGSGNANIRCGSTLGEDDYLIDLIDPIDATTPTKVTVSGRDISTLGAAWKASTGYFLELYEGDEIHVSVTLTGDVTGGKIRVLVKGEVDSA